MIPEDQKPTIAWVTDPDAENVVEVRAEAMFSVCYCGECGPEPSHAIIQDDGCYVIVYRDLGGGGWRTSSGHIPAEAHAVLASLPPPRSSVVVERMREALIGKSFDSVEAMEEGIREAMEGGDDA